MCHDVCFIIETHNSRTICKIILKRLKYKPVIKFSSCPPPEKILVVPMFRSHAKIELTSSTLTNFLLFGEQSLPYWCSHLRNGTNKSNRSNDYYLHTCHYQQQHCCSVHAMLDMSISSYI